jgi:glutathione-regulated potassium-efflux system protein KefB
VLRYCQAIDESLFVNSEDFTDTIILLSSAIITNLFFQSLGLGARPGGHGKSIRTIRAYNISIINYDEIADLPQLGVVLLLFVIGIEINPSRLWKMRLVLELRSLQVQTTGGLKSKSPLQEYKAVQSHLSGSDIFNRKGPG